MSPTGLSPPVIVHEPPHQSRTEHKNRLSLNFLKRPPQPHPQSHAADHVEETTINLNGHRDPPISISEDDGRSQLATARSRSKSNTGKSVSTGGGVAERERTRSSGRQSRDSSIQGRSIHSFQRPPTSHSNSGNLGEALSNSVVNMTKRLSLLRMGRKNSKASVRVDSLQEE